MDLSNVLSIVNTPWHLDLSKSPEEVNIQYGSEYSDVTEQRSKQNSFIDWANEFTNQVKCIDNGLSNEFKQIQNRSDKKIEKKNKEIY